MAATYIDLLFGDSVPEWLEVFRRNSARWRSVISLGRAKINSPATSSAGRLFDAVGAILGIRDSIDYEGQAAIELEQHADASETSFYEVDIDQEEVLVLRGRDLVRAVIQDLREEVPNAIVAARFHNTLAQMVVKTCRIVRSRTGHNMVALSGGVFQNMLLLDRTVKMLEQQGFRALIHHAVPTNDGGISFGQAAIAVVRDSTALYDVMPDVRRRQDRRSSRRTFRIGTARRERTQRVAGSGNPRSHSYRGRGGVAAAGQGIDLVWHGGRTFNGFFAGRDGTYTFSPA